MKKKQSDFDLLVETNQLVKEFSVLSHTHCNQNLKCLYKENEYPEKALICFPLIPYQIDIIEINN